MGGWKLEVFKMAIYMAFPVGMFHFFNQPEYFEEWVKEAKKDYFRFTAKDYENHLMLQEYIKQRRLEDEQKMLESLENTSKNKI